ncbi:ribonuclease pancreatic-like isoform X1 [Sphaerodactylus townsendi]|uniref:ribonuclease pancreatic-like isoform X1 n=1 Tax=Sphaerodactylus townsendi TaxID=933632 RepID=UPI00202641E1|nr:ribonuclease pancreatic-like isoform X1 [Sphaerodactylus townsendi]
MFSKTSSWLLLCYFAVLLVAFLGQPSDGANYADFARKHIGYPKTAADNPNAYCKVMMKDRGMTDGSCKANNTFIHDEPSNIQNICSGGGTRWSGNLYDSRQSFPLTFCRNRGRYPKCNYIGTEMTKRVRVGCVKGLPVHFQTDL